MVRLKNIRESDFTFDETIQGADVDGNDRGGLEAAQSAIWYTEFDLDWRFRSHISVFPDLGCEPCWCRSAGQALYIGAEHFAQVDVGGEARAAGYVGIGVLLGGGLADHRAFIGWRHV